MSVGFLPALVLGIIFALLFFIVDIYNENKTKEINTSLIAGVTITYFFIILLPEIEVGLGQTPLGFYKFIGILIGFTAIHLTEKFILLRVEKKSQIKLKEICEQEAKVIEKEKKVEKSLINKLVEENPDSLSVESLVERLYALKEIRTIQDLWVEEEKKLRKKMLKAELNKFSYMILLSAIKEISKIQRLCLEEEKKLEYSIGDGLQENTKMNRHFKILSHKLHVFEEIRQKEIENVEKKKNMVELLIKSLMADRRDKISKEEFTEKLLILDKEREMLAKYLEKKKDEYDLGKVIIEDTSVKPSEKRATKNLYALEVCRKITEACIDDKKKIEKKLMEVGQNRLLILNRLSALQEISKIQIKCVEEEKKLETELGINYQELLKEKKLTDKINTLKEISDATVNSLTKEKLLKKSLIHKLKSNDDQDSLSIKEFDEILSELEETRKIQEDIVEKERKLEDSLIFNIKRDESEKLTLQELAAELNSFCQLEEELEIQDYNLRVKIQNHINENLDELHLFSNFGYHLLIGIILFALLLHDFTIAILFFVFALFKALVSKTSNDIQLFPGIKINEEYNVPLYLKIFGASSALIGVFVGVLISTIFHVSMDIIFLLFSFISGVILYTIIREVLPENESGRPLYFLLGIIIFLIVIITLRYFSFIYFIP